MTPSRGERSVSRDPEEAEIPNENEPAKAGSFEGKSAATYSPGRLPSEYHRPWQA
jgi:hypothetical protein